jgi:hypothetical protein
LNQYCASEADLESIVREETRKIFFDNIDPKPKPAQVRSHVGYCGDERNCYKWD